MAGLGLQTSDLNEKRLDEGPASTSSSARSPVGGPGYFSDENKRIARLRTSTTGGSGPSSPAIAAGQRTESGAGHRPRISAVSALTAADHSTQSGQRLDEKGFDDSKSDVSSLHEEEKQALGKFDFEDWGGDSRRVSIDSFR